MKELRILKRVFAFCCYKQQKSDVVRCDTLFLRYRHSRSLLFEVDCLKLKGTKVCLYYLFNLTLLRRKLFTQLSGSSALCVLAYNP